MSYHWKKFGTVKESHLNSFKKWLDSRGAEILSATNDYELIRYRSVHGTGIIYTNSAGRLTPNSPHVEKAFQCYKENKKWNGAGVKAKRSSSGKRQLLIRDGNFCFFCGEPFPDDELTIEHLLPVSKQGPNRIENKVLACKPCNGDAGHMSLIEKVKLRDNKREVK